MSSLRNWQLQNNGKKGIRLYKEDFMCDLKWQWDCDKSIAMIRLVKTENPSACVTVNCKVCGNTGSALIACSSEYCVKGVNKSNHPIQISSYKSCAPPQIVTIKFTCMFLNYPQVKIQSPLNRKLKTDFHYLFRCFTLHKDYFNKRLPILEGCYHENYRTTC
jgi:hypothetical protein